MKERPILFSAPMVRAILGGRKTQTRRVVQYKPTPKTIFPILGRDNKPTGEWFFSDYERVGHSGHFCPHGSVGDRLWVRETFQPLLADGVNLSDADWKTGKGYAPRYIATDGRTEWIDLNTDELTDRCKPGIHMPRWASRLTLEIAEVRVQRLQEIRVRDAIEEGAPAEPPFPASAIAPEDHLIGFRSLWDSINAKRGLGWDVNPWVWALTFRRVA